MKTILLSLLLAANIATHAQPEEFKPEEAVDMIALCNSFTFLKEVGNDDEIIPSGYTRIFDSQSIGLDNRFQVYENGSAGAIVIRGTTANPTSWMANIYAAMIPAAGEIVVNGISRPYRFADSPEATVHSGYALGVLFMSDAVTDQIKKLNAKGIDRIYITGHSQGASLATLLHAWLEHQPPGTYSPQTKFKTYAFAGPMVGNKGFAAEYNTDYTATGRSFSVVNPLDMVPNFPGGSGDGVSPLNLFQPGGSSGNDMRSMFVAVLFQQFSDSLGQMATRMGEMLLQQISGATGKIEMPAYSEQYEYTTTGKRVEIEPVTDIPVQPKDGETAAPEPASLQHKPYVYYRSLLRTHFPERHDALTRLVPPGL
jgi:hypothetical protein